MVQEACDVISTFVYRTGIKNAQFARATAIGLFSPLWIDLMIITANTITRKISDEEDMVRETDMTTASKNLNLAIHKKHKSIWGPGQVILVAIMALIVAICVLPMLNVLAISLSRSPIFWQGVFLFACWL